MLKEEIKQIGELIKNTKFNNEDIESFKLWFKKYKDTIKKWSKYASFRKTGYEYAICKICGKIINNPDATDTYIKNYGKFDKKGYANTKAVGYIGYRRENRRFWYCLDCYSNESIVLGYNDFQELTKDKLYLESFGIVVKIKEINEENIKYHLIIMDSIPLNKLQLIFKKTNLI